ncbi:MAG: ferredoxin [Bacteroidetes bacterium HGW-Bacteroidetes-21]|jgi:iron-only hydrogenase group A|nr:MAG: ferredoxin [Bacteroidetes bacterium HGW-Bacteroidetes-21]
MSFLMEVNNKQIEARKGETILDALNRNGLKVPTLCHLKGSLPTGSCRMCVVENLKTTKLITACSTPVEPGMVLLTHSPRVIDSRKTIVELLLSNHPDDCLFCVRNKNCELQDLSEELHVRERRIKGVKNVHHLDRSSASIVRDPDKCILCGRCVRVCDEVMGVSCIDFINRGSQSVIGVAFNKSINTSSCVNCGQCIMVCPTGALSEKSHFPELIAMLNNPEKTVVVQYAPSISVSLAEEFNMAPGTDINGIMNAALRKIGFKHVFDTTFTADLTIMEEAAELVQRITTGGTLPMFTSCCPGWVKFAEEFYSELIHHLSSCKSPQQMMGAVIKSYWAEKTKTKPENIYSVSVMPCTAKKFEAQREEMTTMGITEVDAVLTTRELGQLIHMYGIDLQNIAAETADSPLGFRSSAGKLFGATGGVMEAAIRTAYHMITGNELIQFKIEALRGFDGCKEAQLTINDLTISVAVVNGLANARKLVESIKKGEKQYHFIEIMACPGGCINGGGQHIGASESAVKARMKTLYDIDDKETIKASHKNPEIQQIYKEFLGEPLGHKSHELLHTHYCKRNVLL